MGYIKPVLIGLVAVLIISAGVNIALLLDRGTINLPGITFPSVIPPAPSPTVGEAGVEKFKSEEEFKNYIQEAAELSAGGYFGIGALRGGVATDGMMRLEESALSAMPAPAGIGGGAEPQRVSETNVQVKGIDEPDIVKTDGKEIYFSPESYGSYPRPLPMPLMEGPAIMEDVIMPEIGSVAPGGVSYPYPYPYKRPETKLIKAFPPAELAEDSGIDKTGNLLLSDKKLVIFAGDKIFGYDVSNPKAPKESWAIELEQNNRVETARLHNGKIYLVTRNWLRYNDPCPIIPLRTGGRQLIIPCIEIYHPKTLIPADITYTIMAVDPENGKVEKHVTFLGSQSQSVIYMSPEAVYVAYPVSADFLGILHDFFNEKARDLVPSSLIERLAKLREYDISDSSKMTEFSIVFEKFYSSLNDDERLKIENEFTNRAQDYLKQRARELGQTEIVKTDIDSFELKATGRIPGNLLNQFSLDEYENHLRAATTVAGNRWFGLGYISANIESFSDVYVMDSGLKIVGSVENLGLTERIYSTRFVQDKGYIVTFRQTDPFYVLDLRDPRNPQLKGELKIPGFSSYLHPITKDEILGVGMEGSQVKISLFNVADPADPKEAAKYTLSEHWSEVSSNYHAFLLDDKHGVFFLPGSRGGYIFSYKNSQLSLKKAVSNIRAKRAIYIDDYIYIIGEDKLVVINENDWQEVNKLDFK